MIGKLDGKVPSGPLEQKWRNHKNNSRLVSPNNRRKFEIIVVGSGLAGGSAAATLGELGYRVKCFCYQDSPRRAHSIAAQGGINAAKNYQNDGDSVFRLFYDTIKGGDFRARGGERAIGREQHEAEAEDGDALCPQLAPEDVVEEGEETSDDPRRQSRRRENEEPRDVIAPHARPDRPRRDRAADLG